jgi:general secretion pathway protein F
MPRFSYTAYDEKGTRDSGIIDAETREGAIESLFRQRRYPLELTDGDVVPTPRWWERDLFAATRLSHGNLALLTRELAILVKAEIPIDEALRIARLQPLMRKRARQLLGQVLARVLEGASLSDVLEAQAGVFPPYYAHVVRAGEAAGSLGPALEELAKLLERAAEMHGRIVSALLYPMLLLVAAAGTLFVIVAVLVPTIAPLFQEAGAHPPLVVQALLDVQRLIGDHWLLTIVAMASAIGVFVTLFRSARFRLWWDRMILRVPMISTLVQNGQTAMMMRTLAALVRNGVPILQAMRITDGVLGNRAMAAAVQACAEQVKEGATLAGSLARSGVFPELALRLTAVGEQTGQLDAMLERSARIYEDSLQRQLLRLTNMLTPVLTLAIGLVVGGLMLSVMGALVGINELALR